LGQFPEKLWNFFYATVVVKLREELCHREVSKINAEKEHTVYTLIEKAGKKIFQPTFALGDGLVMPDGYWFTEQAESS
jgi:hypothetical protein